MINLNKKKRWPWLGWGTYFAVGIQILLIAALIVSILSVVVLFFMDYPITTFIIIGAVALIIPIGYFVIHVLGWRPDEW